MIGTRTKFFIMLWHTMETIVEFRDMNIFVYKEKNMFINIVGLAQCA
jgi:hypothetical protein